MTGKLPPCRAYMLSAGIPERIPDRDIRNLCPQCLRARGVKLPRGYADLGGLGQCSVCGNVDICRDPAVLQRYLAAGIDPATVFLRFPLLRHPLHGEAMHMSVIDALITAYMGLSLIHI